MEPPARTCLEQLAEVLDVSSAGALGTRKILGAYFEKDVPGRLVLLFDELDRYAESRGPASSRSTTFCSVCPRADGEPPALG